MKPKFKIGTFLTRINDMPNSPIVRKTITIEGITVNSYICECPDHPTISLSYGHIEENYKFSLKHVLKNL